MASVESIAAWNETLTGELNTVWLLLGAILVFFMQTGFAMLEVGSADAKNTRNILLKNVMDASLGAIVWWTLGYGFATGSSPSGFFGTDSFFLDKDSFKGDGDGYLYGSWLFQWALAATAAAIASGPVAARCTLTAYLASALCFTGVVYPVVVQVAWGGDGYMSKFLGSDASADYLFGCGVLDFAGSGVVHMTGGCAALVGAIVAGPRQASTNGRGQVPTYGPVFQTLGTLVLWFGWYGFNGMSTLAIVGYGQVAAKTMVTTTISAACGSVGALALGAGLASLHAKATGSAAPPAQLEYANRGALAGLVAITAGCSVVEPYGAAVIGFGAAVVYYFSSKFLKKCGVDDAADAAPVHFFCGAYGVLMASLFATADNYAAAYGASYSGQAAQCSGLLYGGDGSQVSANLAFVVFVAGWVGSTTLALFGLLRLLGVLRAADDSPEDEGMDALAPGAPNARKQPDAAGL